LIIEVNDISVIVHNCNCNLQKKYSAVKADCTRALELNPRYAKALLRRARALEQIGNLEAALEDVTTACIHEGFSNQTSLSMADKVLEKLGELHIKYIFY